VEPALPHPNPEYQKREVNQRTQKHHFPLLSQEQGDKMPSIGREDQELH
jgi:hypothetical protein